MERVIHSAMVAENTDVFQNILTLYAPLHSTVVDMTFGRGMFWKRVQRPDLKIVKCDISYLKSLIEYYPDTKINFGLQKMYKRLLLAYIDKK